MSNESPGESRSNWTKIAPVLISLLTAVTAVLSFVATQKLNQIKADQEEEWKRQQSERDALAAKRADAQVIMSYMNALLSDNPQQRRVALNTIYYALGQPLADKLLEGLYETEASAEQADQIVAAIAEGTLVAPPAAAATAPKPMAEAEQKQLVEQFYSKDKTTRLKAFQTVLKKPDDREVLSAILKAGAEGGHPAAATWNAAILANRLPAETKKKLQPELNGFVGQAEQVLTGPDGARLTQKVKSQLQE